MPPRLRMFAGPNGSGKSTLKSVIPPALLGRYLNPDDIERDWRRDGFVDFTSFAFSPTTKELTNFFQQSTLMQRLGRTTAMPQISVENNRLRIGNLPIDSYLSAVLSDYLRQYLLQSRQSFTFETVMSSPDKLDVLQTARTFGFRTYLYYVATEDPLINLNRIRNRVQQGGHPVPNDKVTSRYYRSLDYLLDAVRLTSRAYLFDNSGENRVWVAEITNGVRLELRTSTPPDWFSTYILQKL